jgi:hypothetical protein
LSQWRQYAPKTPAIKARVSNFVQTPSVEQGILPHQAIARNNVGCVRRDREWDDMAISSIVHDTPNEHAADAAAWLASDAHSRRIILDLAEWYERLARLAKLREAQLHQ